MTRNIEQRAERFLRIAGEMEVIAAELEGDVQRDMNAGERLRALSRRLVGLSTEVVTDVLRTTEGYKAVQAELAAGERRFRSLGASPANRPAQHDPDDFFDVQLVDFSREKDCAAMQAKRLSIDEARIDHVGSGERVLFQTPKVPMLDAAGNVSGVPGVARDITARTPVEGRLAAREREFRTLVENSPDMIMRYNRDFRRLYVNPACVALVQRDAASLLGCRPSEQHRKAEADLFEQRLREVFESGQNVEFELHWTQDDGRQLSHAIKMTPEYGADGTVESVLAVGREITELLASREKIRQMAYYDALTGLPNRTLFHERLQSAIAESERHPSTAVMMIDMDRFKGVNDSMGHAAGDELLRKAAERLKASVRPCDTVARFGGDEFAILLPGIGDPSILEGISATILGKFNERFVLNGKEVFVSCSIGIASSPTDSIDAEDLIKYADSAMYLAKRSGRRGFRFYSRQLTADAAKRLALESDLRHAIERGELELHYQPKVCLGRREIIGSEALVRWRRPGIGLVPPNEFVPIAEETGLIADLGQWVLREACRTAADLNAERTVCHKVAVNLSAGQFQFCDLASTVSTILHETGCRPEWLELEITESVLLEEGDTVLGTLSTLKAMGLTIAIDDFGTGYSALSYLVQFPIDTLKIDRSFTQRVTCDRRHAELVKSILSIAQCLGQQVVAEGVETVEQAAFFEKNGCQVAQGFLFSRPLPKADMGLLPRCLGPER